MTRVSKRQRVIAYQKGVSAVSLD